MIYGCIGEHLSHSFSREIHREIGDYPYELVEIPPERLADFLQKRDFAGINVTIPYKEAVIPFLDGLDETARQIGAVNTIVQKNGRLYGYNTDYSGFIRLLAHAHVEVQGRRVAILGTGGTSKTAAAAVRSLGAASTVKVTRHDREQEADLPLLSYRELIRRAGEVDILINTTPVGMFPHDDACPVDPSDFPSLCGVVDAVYHPLRTRLVSEARKRHIPSEGGLYMLTAQAVCASELFLGRPCPDGETDRVFRRLQWEKENIVLTGMPGCGKSTIARWLGQAWNRPVLDTDRLIEEKTGRPVPDILRKDGEAAFRELETAVIRAVSAETGVIVATGGGAVLDPANIDALKRNGRICFLDRPLSDLAATPDRPLSDTKDALRKRFQERYELYLASCDLRLSLSGNPTPDEVKNRLQRELMP